MQIRPFQAAYPDMKLVSSADHFFSTIKEKFGEYWSDGYYKWLSGEGVYACTIERSARTHTGLVACVDIREYFAGHIKRHEKTLPAKETGRLDQLLDWVAQVKPITLTYREEGDIEKILQDYIAEHDHFLEAVFESKGEVHRFWEINDPELIDRLLKLFGERIPITYISDGHHRTASNALMFERLGPDNPANPFKWLPCALFSANEVEIYDFNRIIEGLGDWTPGIFLEKLGELFEIKPLDGPHNPSQKHEITLYLDDKWYQLNWHPQVLEDYKDAPAILDVDILNDKVIVELLGIRDVRRNSRIQYMQGVQNIAALSSKTLDGEERFAFCMYPIDIEDFLAVSDADGTLPPKSTWFEPRLRSGLLVRRFELPETGG